MKVFMLILVLGSYALMMSASPAMPECGEESANQELVQCYSPCPPEGCRTIGVLFSCVLPASCQPGCRCKRNHKRNSSQQCVHVKECPQPFQCGPREEYIACPGDCLDACVQESPASCSLTSTAGHICRPGCRCQEGFCRDDQGECVGKQGIDQKI